MKLFHITSCLALALVGAAAIICILPASPEIAVYLEPSYVRVERGGEARVTLVIHNRSAHAVRLSGMHSC